MTNRYLKSWKKLNVRKTKSKYRLTPVAKEDIKEIWFYPVASWGEKRAEVYIAQLETQLEKLADNPTLGRDRSEINKNYRSMSSEKHVIFYIINGGYVDIIGVLHSSMDVFKYFED